MGRLASELGDHRRQLVVGHAQLPVQRLRHQLDRTDRRCATMARSTIGEMESDEMPTKPKKSAMTDEHKAALAEGRNHARTVGNYLEELDANKPKRGRKRTGENVKKRLTTVESELKNASGLTRLNLLQERRDL